MQRTYQYNTWKDIEALDREHTIVVVPLGATEQHGHHLPLTTDALFTENIAGRIKEQLEQDVPILVLPTLYVGLSVEHMHFPGSLTLQPDTYYYVLRDLCESLICHGFRKIVFLNGHGGNTATAAVVSYDMRAKHGASVFSIDISVLLARDDKPVTVKTAPHCDSHGGELETSLILAVKPELVQMEKAVPTQPSKFAGNQAVTHEGPVTLGWLASDLSPVGNCGNPTYATAEQGETMIQHIVSVACQALREIYAWDDSIKIE